MKFQKQPLFVREYSKLSPEEREKFLETLKVFIASCKQYEQQPHNFIWPASLRFEKLVGFDRIYAITWSFNQPDGRAWRLPRTTVSLGVTGSFSINASYV